MKKIIAVLLCFLAGFCAHAKKHNCTITADTFVALYGVNQPIAEKLLSRCFIFQWTDTVNGVVRSSFRRNYDPKRIENNNDMFYYDIFDLYADSVAFSTTNRKTFLKYKKALLSYRFFRKSRNEIHTIYTREGYDVVMSKETHDAFNVYKILLRKALNYSGRA